MSVAEVLPKFEPIRIESNLGLLSFLEALTFNFVFEGKRVSPVLIYAEPDPDHLGRYIPIQAEDSGYEGIACVDDTARAAVLALGAYEQTGDLRALRLARRWLTFVRYMQYPDGDFANFVRNANGRRNVSGPTSVKGGAWWTARALWALARAYRVTGDKTFLRSYERCTKPDAMDGKIQAVLALGEAELFQIDGESYRRELLERAVFITTCGDAYYRDVCDQPSVYLWGYQQVHAVALVARLLKSPALVAECRRTINNLIEPLVRDRFYYQVGPDIEGTPVRSPSRLKGSKEGLCAYCVTPVALGLTEMYRCTGAERYRRLALQAIEWFSGRNDAGSRLYDAPTGLCADGIDGHIVSPNRGAESSIEAGLAESARRELTSETQTL